MNQTELIGYVQRVREKHPLVHCITNYVTICDCANILLAAGASPTMAHHPEEAAEIQAGCSALVCNFGATDDLEAMMNATAAASRQGHPIVVDPVGVGGSSFRRRKFRELAAAGRITCIRGNASEIRALERDVATVTGVDAAPEVTGEEFASLCRTAEHLAKLYSCIVVASGPVDIVTDGTRTEEVHAGDPLMGRITGSGCMSSALLGAYLAAENSMDSVIAAVTNMGRAGERAAQLTRGEQRGTMTFHMHLIDEVSLM